MKITLSKPFASNGNVDEFDVRQMKKALNRLGYYHPFDKVGITGMPDKGVFEALKSFQADHGLLPTGEARPNDETVRALSSEAQNKTSGKYIWRTADDEKVRDSHASYNKTVRDLADSPDPGQEFNCRCWADPVNCDKELITQNVTTSINDSEQWKWWYYLLHFWKGSGASVTLQDIGWLGPIIDECKIQVFPKIEEQLIKEARKIQQGPLTYTTENSYEFQHISYPIGGATVKSFTEGTVSIHGECLIINATISYEFFDDFTDPADIREGNKKFQNKIYPDLSKKFPALPKDIPDEIRFHFQKGDWTDLKGTPYYIQDKWKTKLSAIIKR